MIGTLENIEYRGEMDASGKPLRVDNVDEVKAGLRKRVDRLAGLDPANAATLRQTFAPLLDVDATSAVNSLDELPNLALAQTTGLKLGETRRSSFSEPSGIGPPLVINRELWIAKADPASGDAASRFAAE